MRSILHFILAVLFFVLITSALSAEFFFSKEAILSSFSFSLDKIGATIAPVDQLFIARLERRFAWNWHQISGILFLPISLYLVYTSSFFNKKIKKILISLVLIMGVTGVFLFSRIYLDVPSSLLGSARTVHYFFSFVVVFFIVTHLILIFKKNKRRVDND